MKPATRRAAHLCLTILLLLCTLLCTLALLGALAACRGRSSFTPSAPPSDPATESGFPADFRCWVRYPDGTVVALSHEDTVEVYAALRKMSRSAKAIDAFPLKEDSLRLVFSTGGSAPEATIPAYQLPNASIYGVFTLFPDDTGWYGDHIITSHVTVYQMKAGTYAAIADMVERESLPAAP